MKIKEYKLEIEGLQRQNLELEERNNTLYNKAFDALRKVSELEKEKAELIELVCYKCNINSICKHDGLSCTEMLKFKNTR